MTNFELNTAGDLPISLRARGSWRALRSKAGEREQTAFTLISRRANAMTNGE